MKYTSLGCLLAAGVLGAGLYAGQARAADLGGDCCADLEERVAELEATTVRKGNRVVSVEISGFVAKELMVWDDGDMSDAYVVGPGGTLESNFTISGEAVIKPGWSAGFDMHFEVISSEAIAVNQLDDDASNAGITQLLSYLWVKSDQLGKLSIGKLSQASDNAAILADFSGTLVQSNWVLFDGAGFFLRPEGGPSGPAGLEGNTIGSLGFCAGLGAGIGADCNGVPLDAIRYDSPTFAGFSVSASWGEDDFWDVAARYAGEWNSIKVKIEGAYSFQGDRDGTQADSEYFQIGGMIMHTPTGLWLYGAYGDEDVNEAFIDVGPGGADLQQVPDNDHWFVKAGIRKQWSSLGHTVLYGEYGQYNDMFGGFSCANTIDGPDNTIGDECRETGGIIITGSEIERWGLGIVQEIDSAAMSVWAKYVNLDPEIDFIEVDTGDHRTQNYEELSMFLVGMMINF